MPVKDFDPVYARLREIMLAAAGDLPVTRDEPGELVVRTHAIDVKTREPGWFGMVAIKKSYVSYHLIPLYEHPALASDLGEALAKRRQGKTCFNFKSIDATTIDELAILTRAVR